MRYTLVVQPDALRDLVQIARWYEEQDAGLGDRFLTSFDRVVVGLELTPEANPVFAGRLRWRRIRPFHNLVIFTVVGHRVEAIAIIDPRGDPATIRQQLRGR